MVRVDLVLRGCKMNIKQLLLTQNPPAIPAFTLSHDPLRKNLSSDKRIATPSPTWKLGYYRHPNHHAILTYSPRVVSAIKAKIIDTKTYSGEETAKRFLAKKIGLRRQYSRWYSRNQQWTPLMFNPHESAGIGAFTGRHIFLGTSPSYFLLSEVLLVKLIYGNALMWFLIEAPDLTKPIDVL